MPRPVSYSKEYDRVRMQLTPGEKILVGEVEDRIANDPSPTLPGRFEDHGYIYETAAQDFVRYLCASLKCESATLAAGRSPGDSDLVGDDWMTSTRL
jgi:hypothetical protein